MDDVDADESDITVTSVVSTKRPTKIGRGKASKKQRIEAVENELLQRAIDCMDKSSASSTHQLDAFDYGVPFVKIF